MIVPLSVLGASSSGLLERLTVVPVGLLLLFFGTFIVRPCLCVASFALSAQYGYKIARDAGLTDPESLTVSVLVGSMIFTLVFAVCEETAPSGAALGACIALSLNPVAIVQTVTAMFILAPSFALLTVAAEREVFIFVTSFGGSFLVWHGLELIDLPNAGATQLTSVPSFVTANSLDMWFGVLSYVTVGCLGCCVQLILLGSGTTSASFSRVHYQPIP